MASSKMEKDMGLIDGLAKRAIQPWCADYVKINGKIKKEESSNVQAANLLSNQEIPI